MLWQIGCISDSWKRRNFWITSTRQVARLNQSDWSLLAVNIPPALKLTFHLLSRRNFPPTRGPKGDGLPKYDPRQRLAGFCPNVRLRLRLPVVQHSTSRLLLVLLTALWRPQRAGRRRKSQRPRVQIAVLLCRTLECTRRTSRAAVFDYGPPHPYYGKTHPPDPICPCRHAFIL